MYNGWEEYNMIHCYKHCPKCKKILYDRGCKPFSLEILPFLICPKCGHIILPEQFEFSIDGTLNGIDYRKKFLEEEFFKKREVIK